MCQSDLLTGIEVLCHSSIRIDRGKILYIDPFRIQDARNDADMILITHAHHDHFSPEDIRKIKKPGSKIILPEKMEAKAASLGFPQDDIICVKPDASYPVDGLRIETVRAYNRWKPFHPKRKNWVGYILEIGGHRYYIAGDTDSTAENSRVRCDAAFVPIGGVYTMDYKKAAEFVKLLRPQVTVPIHYGSIVGKREYGSYFRELTEPEVKCVLLMESPRDALGFSGKRPG